VFSFPSLSVCLPACLPARNRPSSPQKPVLVVRVRVSALDLVLLVQERHLDEAPDPCLLSGVETSGDVVASRWRRLLLPLLLLLLLLVMMLLLRLLLLLVTTMLWRGDGGGSGTAPTSCCCPAACVGAPGGSASAPDSTAAGTATALEWRASAAGAGVCAPGGSAMGAMVVLVLLVMLAAAAAAPGGWWRRLLGRRLGGASGLIVHEAQYERRLPGDCDGWLAVGRLAGRGLVAILGLGIALVGRPELPGSSSIDVGIEIVLEMMDRPGGGWCWCGRRGGASPADEADADVVAVAALELPQAHVARGDLAVALLVVVFVGVPGVEPRGAQVAEVRIAARADHMIAAVCLLSGRGARRAGARV